MRRRFFLVLALSASALAGPRPYEVLSSQRLVQLEKSPCTFIHLWATWCWICVQELPSVLQSLHQMPQVHPVVLDISMPGVQDGFSKKWLKTLNPPFTTYLKPGGKDEAYLKQIDPQWNGSLPFSVLYHRGKRKTSWSGRLDLVTLRKDLETLCR